MKAMIQTAKTLLGAMAFANVSNLGEFRTLLRQVDRPADELDVSNCDASRSAAPHAAVLHNAQGAL